jgi:hypothetical protein
MRTGIDLMRIRIRVFPKCGSESRVLMTKNFTKFTAVKLNFFAFLYRKFLFSYPYASIKDAQASGEAFIPKKRTPSTSKHENSSLFSIFVGHFCPPGSGSSNSN